MGTPASLPGVYTVSARRSLRSATWAGPRPQSPRPLFQVPASMLPSPSSTQGAKS